ncbi:uncharacterized protein LOC123202054 [Mangifera indica]|uniref:uncharacterized protein LOC123202054 n=1 Tax=Mangifera indica TaxID=29780 RepID=UPI001CFB826B|nr:uncharacterized protein LOC123202054 [Mangifera indica]
MLANFGTRIRLPSFLISPLHSHGLSFFQTLKMAAAEAKAKRPICPFCSKPTRICLCNRIQNPGLENSVGVTILQHSLERKHPLNSTRIAKLGLKNVTVATVSDVNFDARFEIRLLEPGSGQLVLESEGFDQELERGNDVSLAFKKFKKCLEEKNRSLIAEEHLKCSEIVLEQEDEPSSNEDNGENGTISLETSNICDENNGLLPVSKCNEEPVVTLTIGKYGVINDIAHKWVPSTGYQKPNFDQILDSQLALDALAKGFIVKKMQKRELSGGMGLEENQEFELEVLPGSILLFPSERACSAEDLEVMHLEVKNLIVLDGTWAKAKRIYNENPWLKLLPHLKLDLDKLSLYSEVRHQPRAGYLSTIESIVYALQALGENADQLNNLLDVFESMVGDQRRCKVERLSKVSPI